MTVTKKQKLEPWRTELRTSGAIFKTRADFVGRYSRGFSRTCCAPSHGVACSPAQCAPATRSRPWTSRMRAFGAGTCAHSSRSAGTRQRVRVTSKDALGLATDRMSRRRRGMPRPGSSFACLAPAGAGPRRGYRRRTRDRGGPHPADRAGAPAVDTQALRRGDVRGLLRGARRRAVRQVRHRSEERRHLLLRRRRLQGPQGLHLPGALQEAARRRPPCARSTGTTARTSRSS